MSNKHLARRWVEEVWNERSVKAIGQLLAKNGVTHGLAADGQDLIGPDGSCRFTKPSSRVSPIFSSPSMI